MAKLKRIRAAVAALACVATAGACTQAEESPAAGLSGRLKLSGSSTCAPLVSEIAKRFETAHPRVRIDVQTGGSSMGIADASNGLSDIAMSSRPLEPSERGELITDILAQDGVCFIVHASNPVSELSDAEIRSILSGEIDDWSLVGGTSAPITLIQRAAGRSELELVIDHFGIEAASIQADAIAGDSQQGIKQVASDPHAITYMSVGASVHEAERGTPIKLLPLGGVEASTSSVAAGQFPLPRPLLLISKPPHSELTRAFLEYTRSSAVHDLVKDHSFVPVPP